MPTPTLAPPSAVGQFLTQSNITISGPGSADGRRMRRRSTLSLILATGPLLLLLWPWEWPGTYRVWTPPLRVKRRPPAWTWPLHYQNRIARLHPKICGEEKTAKSEGG